MCKNNYLIVISISCGLLFSYQFSETTASNAPVQPLLHGGDDGTLIFEAARDQNITFRLMGDSAGLLLNEVDILSLLQRRQRVAAAAESTTTEREPLSLDALQDQFRDVQRDLVRLSRWLTNMHNGTRRSGLPQRVLRRTLQRVQVVENTLKTLEANLLKDECSSNPCKNGGTCYDSYKSFHCDCPAAWQGTTCEDDVNECFDFASTDLAVCRNDAHCINTPGSYRCVCRPGYSGAHCRLHQNVCLANQSSELCGSHGTCLTSNNAAGFVCICDQGWTWADTNVSVASASPCTRDVEECAPEINPCHNECINLPGSFRCGACPLGYTGDGKYCRDIDECSDGNNGGCSRRPSVSCINTEGSYRCGRCPIGWTGDGHSCEEAKSNSCNGEQICHPSANCEYISDTVVCSCPVGFFGHGYGSDGCTEDSDRKPCDNHPCLNNGTCVLSGRGTSCICQPGYKGALCGESDACHPNPCQNGGTCRLQPRNEFMCVCPAGFSGSNCHNIRRYCGTILRNETGSLQFPGSEMNTPVEYQPSERCPFIIATRRGMILNVTFGLFDLESSNDCTADFLQLHDGSSLTARLIGRFCGNKLPLENGTIITTQEQMFLWFLSNNATQGRGFNLTWTSKPMVCGEELNLKLGQTGVLRSPSYPAKTRPGVDCRWHLDAPFGTRFLLHFYEITLGLGNNPLNCSNADHLLVKESNRELYLACQSAQPEPLYSSSNQLYIHFHTDSYRMDSSFQLHYEVIAGHPNCGGLYTEARGVIRGFAENNVCLYLIQQPKGTQIQLNLKRLKLFGACRLQQLEIFDGSSEDSPLLRRFCEESEETGIQPIISTGNVVLVRYEYGLTGFDLNFNFEMLYSRACVANFSDAEGGIIMTPNYPNGYIENMDCTFNIRGRYSTKVQINITDLSLSEMVTSSDSTILVGDPPNFLDVYLSQNRSEKQRITKNLTNHVLVSTYNQLKLIFHGSLNPQRARGLRLEYKFLRSQCGGVATEPSGYFRTLLVTPCQFIIESPGRKELTVTLKSLLSKPEYIYIYDNDTLGEPKLLNSFQVDRDNREFNMKEYTDSNLITIFVPNTARTMFILHINYKPAPAACGGNFTARYGTIKSPNWPQKYGASENCNWIIKVPFGERIELTVHNFTLENYCRFDFLEIRNGDHAGAPLIGKYCGTEIPPRVPSFGNALYVHFQSDDSDQYEGFYLNWQLATSGCGGKLTSATGAIHSPHSMRGNRGAVACDWQISVSLGSTVQMDLESPNNLCSGQLSIYDGPTTQSRKLAMNCSNDGRSMSLLSTGNQVTVRYDVVKDAPEGIDFVLDYTTNCHMRLEKSQGAIETPNFPEKYPPYANCEWDIRAGEGNKVQLTFSHLTVELLDDSCSLDFVLLRDYRDNNLIGERRLCKANDETITSEGNRLVIQFKSDFSIEAQGFHAEYKRLGCGEELGNVLGRIESPNAPYSVDLNCHWHITAPEGYQIRLVLNDLHIETSQRDCSQDSFTVSTGSNTTTNVLYRSCQVETSVQTIVSPANELYVRFQSSPQRARKFFNATYVQFEAKCGGRVSASNGIIMSPGFYQQGQLDKNVECVWNVEVTDSYAIQLDFETLNLNGSCDLSQVVITGNMMGNAGAYNQRVCGEDAPDSIVLQNNVRVHFKASAGTSVSFSLRYKRVCGGLRTDNEGYLNSQLDSKCYWTIQGAEGSKISLNINQLECQNCTASNCTTGLRVLNAEDEVTYYNLCQEHPASLMIPTNKARIEAVGIVLSAQYSTIDNSCGGNIYSARGTLSSPNYPESYPSNVECDWLIMTRAGNGIELTFEAMDIAKSEHCNLDFLEVRADHQGPLLGLYCNNVLPSQPLISNSKIWIKFRSQAGSSGNGFKLRWNYVHDVELRNMTNGTIESPPTLTVRGDEQPYSWRIFPATESVVVLDLREYNTGLQIFDGYDDSGIPIEINHSPWQFISSTNVLYLKTVNTEFDSFWLTWKTMVTEEVSKNETLTEGCGRLHIMERGTRVVVTSPGYPHGYKPRLNCEWTFETQDKAQHLYVDLIEAQLENSEDCQWDYLSIQSSSSLVNWQEQLRVCNVTARPFQSQKVKGTPNLKLKFVTDISMNGTGFKAIVNTDCGSNMTDSVGTITSSNLLRIHLSNSNMCEWHIDVRPGRVIDVNIEYNGQPIQSSKSCPYYGLIYDGIDALAPLLPNGKFCNHANFSTISYRTSGPHATIRYYLPEQTAFANPFQNNWTLTYREFRDCNTEIRLTHLASSYLITTPGYPDVPHPHSDCTWLILAPLGETISANFVDVFDLSTHECDKEYVEMYDGSTMLSRRLFRTCRRLGTHHSSGNLLLLHYQTELNEPHAGFSLNVSLSHCGGQHITSTGIVTSENYPALGAYPKPADCEYVIKVYRSSRLEIQVNDVHLPYNANASAEALDRIEFLDLADQRRVLLVLYGNMTNFPYVSLFQTHEIAVRFVAISTNVNSFRGFKLRYYSVAGNCNRDITAASGDLEIQRTLFNDHWTRFCIWSITVPKGQRVRFELLNLGDLTNTTVTYTGILRRSRKQITAFNDAGQASKIIEFDINSYHGNGIIESSDNFMMLFILMSTSLKQKTLRARFSSREASLCPPDIERRSEGTLSIQELIQMPTYSCKIKFTAEPGETLSFYTQYSKVADQAFVRFRDDEHRQTNALETGNANFSLASTAGYVLIAQKDPAAHLRFSSSFRRFPCGGSVKLTESTIIELPRLEDQSGNLDCVWTLDNSDEYGLKFSSRFSDSCDSEYVTISSRNDVTRLCRDMAQTNNNTIRTKATYKVHYHSTHYNSGSSEFQLKVMKPAALAGIGQIVKIEDYSTSTVNIDAKEYKNNMELNWEYQTTAFMQLRLEFQGRFFIETSPNCSNDQLVVYSYQSDLWQPISTLCGRELPPTLYLHSNRMRIVFRSNANITGDGFTFKVSATCDLKLKATNELQSFSRGLGLRERFKPMKKCNYEITTDTKHQILVMVKGVYDVAWSASICRYTHFEAYRQIEGNEQQEELINNNLCPSFEVSGYGKVRVVSSPLGVIRDIPFELQFHLIGCGGNYSAPFTLRPPLGESVGAIYKGDQSCVWHIIAPPQHAIFLNFKYFDLQYDCSLNELIAYRGSSQSKEQLISRLCGNLTTPSIMIDSNEALIVSKLNGYAENIGRGFIASVSFTPNCNERLALSEGNSRMSLARQFQLNSTDDLHCYFRASAPFGYRLSISMKQLQLNGALCSTCSSVEVIDGFDRDSASLGKYYALLGNGTKVFSSTNDVLIKLSGTKPSQSINIELMLQMEATVCGQLERTLRSNETVNLRLNSTNITDSYEGSVHCEWHFSSEDDIQIDMHAVQLQEVSPVTRKCIDYLVFKGEHQVTRLYCGKFYNSSVIMPKILGLDVEFHSSGGGTPYALDITLRNKIKCNVTLTALDGTIEYYAVSEEELNYCVHEIRVPKGFSVALELEYVYFDSETSAYLRINDLQANRTLLNATGSYLSSGESFLSTSNVIQIVSQKLRQIKLYYHSNINTLPTGCGGDLTSLEGQFANPPYENRNYSECIWRISVPAGNSLQITFRQFDMGPDTNCELDNVKIYEVLPDNSENLRRLICGHYIPESFNIDNNRVKIVAKKSPNFAGTGFRLFYYHMQN